MIQKWSEYALIRAAYQVASPSQKAEMYDLATRADAGNGDQYRKLKTYALELVQQAERPRSKAAGSLTTAK